MILSNIFSFLIESDREMGTNSGDKGKKYGEAGTKRGRFNANPTKSSHPSCTISQRAKLAKAANLKLPRIVKVYTSKAKSHCAVERV